MLQYLGGGCKALTMTMTHWNFTHGQGSKLTNFDHLTTIIVLIGLNSQGRNVDPLAFRVKSVFSTVIGSLDDVENI